MLIPRSKAPTHRYRCLAFMHDPSYYRSQAERARRLALVPTDRGTQNTLLQMAQDYLDLVEDLESGAIEIRHPELMQQNRHRRKEEPRRRQRASRECSIRGHPSLLLSFFPDS